MNEFYVYELTDITGVPFYIGKGMKKGKYDRLSYHKNSWHHNKNKKLTNKIKKLNGVFNSRIIKMSFDENECLNLEIKLIKDIGLDNLCNLTEGGEGISGYKHTKNTRKKMSQVALKPNRIKISKQNLHYAVKKNIGYRKLSDRHDEIIKLYETKSICEMQNILKSDFAQIKRYLVEHGLYIKNKNRKPMSIETKKKQSDIHKKIWKQKNYDRNFRIKVQ